MLDRVLTKHRFQIGGLLDSEGMPGMGQEFGLQRQQFLLDDALGEVDDFDDIRG